jgi:hypothetical protein
VTSVRRKSWVTICGCEGRSGLREGEVRGGRNSRGAMRARVKYM